MQPTAPERAPCALSCKVLATAYFVQFPHPGCEHKPRVRDMPWNVGNRHRRKFLTLRGRYTGAGDGLTEAQLVFWGEWEPPSGIEHRWPKTDLLPRVLHRPYWGIPNGSSFRQNTDPWVFGDAMVYSNCRQTNPNSMVRLTRGSVICFGSTTAGEFCLDTVLVVDSAEPWIATNTADINADEAFVTCTAESVATSPRDRNLRFMLYRGATFDQPVDGMFSFVPARRADAKDPRFARPAIDLPELINPASQGPRGSNRPIAIEEVREAWEAIKRQVVAEDLLLAVHLETPPRVDDAITIPRRRRARGRQRR